MMVSPGCRYSASDCTVCSVGPPAGTMIQTARGALSLLTRSCREEDPTAPSPLRSLTACRLRSETTTWCPPRIRRRVMLAPIRPSPTIPSCMRVLLRSICRARSARMRCGPAPLGQHLEIAARLRCLHDPEGILLPGHRNIHGIVAGHLQEDPAVGSSLVRLSGGVQKARAKPKAGGHVFLVADCVADCGKLLFMLFVHLDVAQQSEVIARLQPMQMRLQIACEGLV